MQVISAAGVMLRGAPGSIMYLPKGRNSIRAKVDGKPSSIDITVDEAAADRLQAALEARQADNVRPILDFDHNDSGPASGIPKRFFWDDDQGVMLELEWTGAGKQAIEAKDYSYFSPLFMIDGEGRPIGLHEQRPIGALVNDPAFRNIRRIAAKNAQPEQLKQPRKMDLSKLVECGAITADQAKGDDAPNVIAAAFATKSKELEAARADLKSVTEDRDKARAELQAHNEARATAAIDKAVEAGAIQSKDDESKAFWKELILEKGESAIRQLEAKAPVRPGIDQPIVKQGGAITPNSTVEAASARAATIRNRAESLRKERNIPFSQAWGLAAAEQPA